LISLFAERSVYYNIFALLYQSMIWIMTQKRIVNFCQR